MWLYEYWDSLEWYDSDVFDGIMEERVMEKVKESKNGISNGYYGYLCGKHEKYDVDNGDGFARGKDWSVRAFWQGGKIYLLWMTDSKAGCGRGFLIHHMRIGLRKR